MKGKSPEEIWELLKYGVVNFDEEIVMKAAELVLENNYDVYQAVMNGLISGIEEVGKLYEQGQYLVAEMMMCSDVLYTGLNVLRPYLKQEERNLKGQILIGVVQGDIHDIGKNILKMMFGAVGFEVHDLGKDVPLEEFVNEQRRTDCEIVCISAMMTDTMHRMGDIIKKIKKANPKVKIMVGGAPVDEKIARKWGADAYAQEASNAIKHAIQLVASLKKLQNPETSL